MKIGIIGAGAVGGYYGAMLVKSGFDVHFLVRSGQACLRDHGLLVESIDGDILLDHVQAWSSPEDMPVCDLVVVAVKTTENHHLSSILPKITAPGGSVIVLQNGLGVEAQIAEMILSVEIIGGLCFLCSRKIKPGHIHHMAYGSIRLGQYRKAETASGPESSLNMVMEIFNRAGVSVQAVDNLEKARWEKLVWNMAFNGLCVILDTTTGSIMKSGAGRGLVKEIMLEVIAASNACGYPIEEKFADALLRTTGQMPDYSPSMKTDFDEGRSLEIEAIYRHPIHAAGQCGFNMPRCRVIAEGLDFLMEQRPVPARLHHRQVAR